MSEFSGGGGTRVRWGGRRVSRRTREGSRSEALGGRGEPDGSGPGRGWGAGNGLCPGSRGGSLWGGPGPQFWGLRSGANLARAAARPVRGPRARPPRRHAEPVMRERGERAPRARPPFRGTARAAARLGQELDRPGAQVCKPVGVFFFLKPHPPPAVTRGFPKGGKMVSCMAGRHCLKKAESSFGKDVSLEGE